MTKKSEEALEVLGQVQNLGFVEFTSDLVRNVYKVITDSAMEQLQSYGDLVTTVSKSLAEYQKDVTGITFNDAAILSDDNKTALDSYIEDVLGFTTWQGTPPKHNVSVENLEMLESHFVGITILDETILKAIGSFVINDEIEKDDLRTFVYHKIAKSSSQNFSVLTTIIKLGMQKVVVTDGTIHTKLVFHVDSTESESKTSTEVARKASSWGVSGSVSANWGWGSASVSGYANSSKVRVKVVNEKSNAAVNVNADIIGSVTIKFRTETFPPTNLE